MDHILHRALTTGEQYALISRMRGPFSHSSQSMGLVSQSSRSVSSVRLVNQSSKSV